MMGGCRRLGVCGAILPVSLLVGCSPSEPPAQTCVPPTIPVSVSVVRDVDLSRLSLVGAQITGCLSRDGEPDNCTTKVVQRLDDASADEGTIFFGGDPADAELRAQGWTFGGLVAEEGGRASVHADFRLSEGAPSSVDLLTLRAVAAGGDRLFEVHGELRWDGGDARCFRSVSPREL